MKKQFLFLIIFSLLHCVGRNAEAQTWDSFCNERVEPCTYIAPIPLTPCHDNLVLNGDFETPTSGMTLPPINSYYFHNLNEYCAFWTDAADQVFSYIDVNNITRFIDDPDHITTCSYFHRCGGLVCDDFNNNMAYYNSMLPHLPQGAGCGNMIDSRIPDLLNNRENCVPGSPCFLNNDDFQETHSGDAFIGMFSCPDTDYDPNGQLDRALSEIAEGELVSPLQDCHLYYAEMFAVRHGNPALVAVPPGTFGMIFTIGGLPEPPPEWDFAHHYDNVYPQFLSTGAPYLTLQVSNSPALNMLETVNWQHIVGGFFGQGEDRVAIGYFPTSVSAMATIDPLHPNRDTYYYVDDVTVYEIEPVITGEDMVCCSSLEDYSIECFGPGTTLEYTVTVTNGTINGQSVYSGMGDVLDPDFQIQWNTSNGCGGSVALHIESTDPTVSCTYDAPLFNINFCSDLTNSQTCSIWLGTGYPGGVDPFPNSSDWGGGIISSQLVEIRGIFTIDNSFFFSGCQNIKMWPDAKIELTDPFTSHTLTFTNCNIEAICDAMWDHILVVNPYSVGGVDHTININNSIIKQGKHAIDIIKCANLDIHDNLFDQNYVDIRIRSCNGSGSAPPEIPCCCSYTATTGSIYGNDFLCTKNLLPPFFPNYLITDTAISVQDALITIGNSSSLQTRNYFEKKTHVGIAGINSDLTVINGEFSLIPYNLYDGGIQTTVPKPAISCVGVPGTTGVGTCYSSLYAGNINGSDPQAANFIHDCNTGIYAKNLTIAQIIGNNIWMCPTATLAEMCQYSNGIYPDIDINDNIMDCVSIGVALKQNKQANIMVRNNTMQNINEPTSISSYCYGIWQTEFAPTYSQSAVCTIAGNHIFGGRIGIFVVNAFKTYVQDNDIHLVNNSITKSGISIYNNSIPKVRCNYSYGDNPANISTTAGRGFTYALSPGGFVECNHSYYLNRGFHFEQNSGSNVEFRTNEIYDHFRGTYFTSSAVIGLQGDNNLPVHVNSNQWYGPFPPLGKAAFGELGFQSLLSRFYVYPNTPVYNPPSTIVSFTALTGNPTQQNCGVCFSGLMGGGESGSGEMIYEEQVAAGEFDAPLFDEEQEQIAQKQVYDMLVSDTSGIYTSGILDSFKFANQEGDIGLLNAVSVKLEDLNDASVVFDDTMIAEIIDEAIGINNSVTGSNLVDENEKAVNSIYLVTVAKGISSFNSDQLDVLHFVANQCPLEGGGAVYQARSLLWLTDSELWWDDEAICGEALRLNEEKPKIVNEVQSPTYVYPNPSTGMVVLHIGSSFENAQLIIYNAIGEILFSENLVSAQHVHSIDMKAYPQGLYHFTLNENENLIASGNFSLMK